MRFSTLGAACLITVAVLAGCSAPTTEKTGSNAVREPDLTLQVGSLNLSGFNKKFDKKDIDK
ncbi:MAG TPA: hypothetical protein VI758_01880, partial [Bacteroidota bacterium]